ncbi:metallophosphoesterase family protein [Alcaligenes sp. SDU_A2]|uniref:metallophosphoesterase family protein n=1 Tax=Alcaligenes sp. SDU_A2 TaxID=3136634 RepID=UPI00311E8DCB
MIRLLHTADWQIGRNYARFALEDAAALADARFLAIETIAQLAVQEQADVIVVAGDVFDSQTLSDRSLRRAFNAMAGFTGPWVLLPGNHDAALSESVWTRARRLGCVPEQVHIVDKPDPLELASLRLTILPAPLTQRQTYHDLTAWFDQASSPADHVRVGLAHGSISGLLEHIDSHNQIDQDRATHARLDYLALGDWHGTLKVNDRCYYSGTPEPDRFRNNDSGQVVLVELDGPGALPVLRIVPTARHAWFSLAHELSDDMDLDVLEQALANVPEQSVVELVLDGQLSLSGFERLNTVLGQAEARCRAWSCQQDNLRLAPTEADLQALQADGYLRAAVEQLQKLRTDTQDPAAQDALLILASLLRDKGDRHAH